MAIIIEYEGMSIGCLGVWVCAYWCSVVRSPAVAVLPGAAVA